MVESSFEYGNVNGNSCRNCCQNSLENPWNKWSSPQTDKFLLQSSIRWILRWLLPELPQMRRTWALKRIECACPSRSQKVRWCETIQRFRGYSEVWGHDLVSLTWLIQDLMRSVALAIACARFAFLEMSNNVQLKIRILCVFEMFFIVFPCPQRSGKTLIIILYFLWPAECPIEEKSEIKCISPKVDPELPWGWSCSTTTRRADLSLAAKTWMCEPGKCLFPGNAPKTHRDTRHKSLVQTEMYENKMARPLKF